MQKTLVLAFILLGESSAYAQAQSRFGNAEFSYQHVSPSPTISSGAMNVTACTFTEPLGRHHAGISFDLALDGLIHIQGTFYNGLECAGSGEIIAGDLQLPAGHNIVYYVLDLPDGSQVSMIWSQVGVYTSSCCSPYDVPVSPPECV